MMFRNIRRLGDMGNVANPSLLLCPSDFVSDLKDGEVEFDCRLCRFGGKVVANQRRQFMPGLRKLRRLLQTAVLQCLQGLHVTHH